MDSEDPPVRRFRATYRLEKTRKAQQMQIPGALTRAGDPPRYTQED